MSSRAAEQQSIGEVITVLREEFPELSVSKIRFLEGQGLIEPERSPSGYRLFSQEDVKRIAFILREQRDNYLPLKVIKSRLASWDRGEEPTDVTSSGPPPESYFATAGLSMTPEELMKAAGLQKKTSASPRPLHRPSLSSKRNQWRSSRVGQ